VGLPVSLILIAVGAILAFAVHHDPNAAVNVHVVGWILMATGFVLFLISCVLWRTWWGAGMWGYGYYDEPAAPVVRRRAYWPARRRTTYVEEEPPPPDAPY
jgi:hypothetical protein